MYQISKKLIVSENIFFSTSKGYFSLRKHFRGYIYRNFFSYFNQYNHLLKYGTQFFLTLCIGGLGKAVNMADTGKPRDNVAPTKPCKRCKTVALSGLKCAKCDTVSHNSCVRIMKNVITIGNNEIICCESGQTVSDGDMDFFDAMDEKQMNKVDSHLFGYIIRQKDILIKELYDKIDLLRKQIELMNEIKTVKSSMPTVKDNRKNAERLETKTVNMSPTEKQVNNEPERKNRNSQTTIKTASAGLLETQTKLTMNKYIHIQDEAQCSKEPLHPQIDWTLVDRKKNKTINKQKSNHVSTRTVVGKNTDVSSSLKGVPKQVDLHVYRVAPNTDVETISNFLRKSFPEVSCEALVPRYPNLYSSFKIRIYEKHLERAMDPLVWPEDACVRPFLYRRSNNRISLPQNGGTTQI